MPSTEHQDCGIPQGTEHPRLLMAITISPNETTSMSFRTMDDDLNQNTISGNYLSFAFVLCTMVNFPFIRKNGISKYLYESDAISIVRADIVTKITIDATSFCINSAG